MRCPNVEIVWRRAAGGRQRSDAQPMGVYFDRPAEADAVKQRPCALTLAQLPALLALEVAESRGLKGNACETGRLPGLAGRRAVTICRQIEGLLCCPALTSAPRQAIGRVNRAGLIFPCMHACIFLPRAYQALRGSRGFPCMHACIFLPRAYQALRGSRPRGMSVPFFLPPSHSAFH